MDFNNTLFAMPLMVGTIFSVAGFIVFKYPPKKINMLYGYRTSSSMKNQESWNFAQIYSSKLMIFCGLVLSFSSVLGLFFKISEGIGVLISTVMILIAVLSLLFFTEKAINKKFNEK